MKITGGIHSIDIIRDDRMAIMIDAQVKNLMQLEQFKDKLLVIELQEYKPTRTLDQNAFLWSLIHEIDVNQNGRPSRSGSELIYINLLYEARIKVIHLTTYVEAFRDLEKTFRVVKQRETRNHKGKEIASFECFWGSSYFTKEEMSQLIENALDLAAEVGVNTKEYQEEWNEFKNDKQPKQEADDHEV